MNMEQLLICLSLALIAGLLMSRLAKVAHPLFPESWEALTGWKP